MLKNGTKATFDLQFHLPTTGIVPFLFDAWTGSQEAIAIHETNGDEFQIPITLEQFQFRFIISYEAMTLRAVTYCHIQRTPLMFISRHQEVSKSVSQIQGSGVGTQRQE